MCLPGQLPTVGDVLRRAPDGQLYLGWEAKWGNLDFAHIPVGVLSQAYELHLRSHAPSRQRREGGYYTPRTIAGLMVRASFGALERQCNTRNARILDPATGGGIFLLTAFRELVAAHWRADGRRPDTEALRAILYGQLVGFDINEEALRFAALGLYLMSIELDPNPRPVDRLRFRNLRGTVLHRVKADDEREGASLGSLGPSVGPEHVGRYDLVIGNPPWASGTQLANWEMCAPMVAAWRGEECFQPQIHIAERRARPPFCGVPMEWRSPKGKTLALHARGTLVQGNGMPGRQALRAAGRRRWKRCGAPRRRSGAQIARAFLHSVSEEQSAGS